VLRLLTILTALFSAGIAPAPDVIELEPGLSVRQVGDGLWLHRSDWDWGDGKPITSNGVLVIGDHAIAMIDTAWTDDQTAKILDWAEERFDLPVRHVFATHWHQDKMGGMGEVNRRGIWGYGLELTAQLGMKNNVAVPRIRFAESIRVELGNETIEMRFAGPGHTLDNTIVWLEDRKVLIGGCLIKSDTWTSLGYIDDADVEEWAPTLRRVLARYSDALRVVPGHGEIGDLDLVRHTLKLAE
jgi:metallo-beta-lactamase class B